MSFDINKIEKLLGDDAETLLSYVSKTIPKENIQTQGADFIDRVWLASDRNPNVLRSLQTLFDNGRLAKTGYLSILPVDQGIEHSAGASFAPNPQFFDPENIVKLAIEGGCNAVASTFGVLGIVARKYAHKIPFIVKINHNELEEKVAERTAELARTNEILMAEIAERKRIENKLLTSQKQLRDLSAHLESVREEERKYLARELHDELGQTLTALKIDLTKLGEKMPNVQNENVRLQILDRIPAMIEIVDMSMETTRKIIAELRPGILDELGLVAAAEWLVQEFQKRTGIKCGLKIDFEDKDLPQNIKTAMFRILQECLTNITRHAAAQNVKIELTNGVDFLLLIVEDNGRGISKKKLQTTKSFGVLGMRERAFLLGGTLEISRPENGGTRVTVQIPQQINEYVP